MLRGSLGQLPTAPHPPKQLHFQIFFCQTLSIPPTLDPPKHRSSFQIHEIKSMELLKGCNENSCFVEFEDLPLPPITQLIGPFYFSTRPFILFLYMRCRLTSSMCRCRDRLLPSRAMPGAATGPCRDAACCCPRHPTTAGPTSVTIWP